MNKEQSTADMEHPVLTHALALCHPLAKWLIRHGIGHAQFAAGLKNVFFLASEQELKNKDQKLTNSAVSLMSGLHRKDVKNLKGTGLDETCSSQVACTTGKPSVANQTFTRWLTGAARQESLPLHGPKNSFEQLVSSISKDVHHSAVLQELVRLGLVMVDGDSVVLIEEAFVPKQDQIEAWQLMMASVTDHLSAGVHNLTSNQKKSFLEQSVFIDGLSPESAQKLNVLANSIWDDALQRMVQAATPLCDQGPGTQEYRFRLGIFSFTASVESQLNQEPK